MQVKHDIYNLSKSKPINISEKELDIKIDVVLNDNKNPLNINSSVSGIVVDTLNNPIKNAIVKLISSTLDPLASARTDDNGKYFINIVPSSTRYTVLATSVEKIVNQSPSFTLNTGESKIINFTLSNDPNGLFGTVSGTLTDGNNKALKGAVIFIYKIEDSSTNLFAITYSDLQGTFLFSELLAGKYKISVQSLISTPYEEFIIVESKKIYNFSKSLSFISNLSDGSISGTITDNLGNNISKADVILYKVENNIKIPVAFTQTNTFGLYSFGNVPFGDYLVKSNATQSLDINNIVSPSVKITSTSELGTYNLSEGVLENGAMVDYSTKFVTALGGVNDGAITLSLKGIKYGLYTLAVYYLAADFNRSLKVEVNGQDINEIYKVSITPGWDITDSKIIYIDTPLNEGLNNIKFHGDGKNLAPNISMVTLILNQTTSETMGTTTFALSSKQKYINITTEGTYSNGAKYDEKTLLATGIGGTKNGTVTVELNISDTTVYYMQLLYLSTTANLVLKMDIINNFNNSSNTYTLTLPSTNKTTNSTALSAFTVPIDLSLGKNEIKFYGNGKISAPDLSGFFLVVPPVTSNLTEGFLENGAKIHSSKKFVENIGGANNGSSIVTIDIAQKSYYKLYLEYVASTTVPLKIDVNTTKPSTIVYMLPRTKGITTNDTKIFDIIIYLNTGYNTLKFYGNGKDLGPTISSFVVAKVNSISENILDINLMKDIYDPSFAKLEGSAILDKGNLKITSLGGKNNGSATFNIMVKDEGEYILVMSYENNKSFKIDVNGVNTNKIYTTFGKIKGVFRTTINLKAGKNTIKIYGNGSELAPDIGEISLSFNAPLWLKKEDFLFFEGARLLTNGVITSIGGENQGIVSIGYFSSEYAEYTLNFVISNNNGEFLVKVNDTQAIVKNISTTKATTIPYSVNVVLNDGFNFIDILGNGNKATLDIYSVEIKPTFSDISKYTFNLSGAILKSNSIINMNNGFVKNLGGKNKGVAILTFKLDKADFYDLNIQYINEYDIDTPLRITVNGKTIDKTYYIPKKTSTNLIKKIFVIENILLNQGSNAIEFTGDNVNYVADLGKIRLSKVLNTNTVPSNLYYSINGTLSNGAKIASFSKNFIDNLGGTPDGSLTMKINVSDNDFYNLTVVYVSTDNRILLIEVNGEDSGAIYTLTKTDALKEENSKMFETSLMLKKGDNFIKFHGDKTNLAPSIGKIYVNKSPEINTYNFSSSILENATVLDSPEGFVLLSENTSISSATIKVTVEESASYYLTFNYLSLSQNSIIIETNYDFSNKKLYNLSPTKSKNIIDAKSFTVKVNLRSGENRITFLKSTDTSKNQLLLQLGIISRNLLVATLELKKAMLSNGVYFNEKTGYVEGLGGFKSGYAIMDILVEKAALYNLVINYISLNTDRKLKVKVNNIGDSKNYDLPTTGKDINKIFAKTFTIPIDLKSGMNSIKIYGDRNSKEGPMINEITLNLNTEDLRKIYYLSDGIIKAATFNNTSKTVSNIGGKDNGEVTIKLNMQAYNIYNLNLQYKSINKPNVLLLDVNNTGDIESYTLPMTFNNDFNIFNIPISLNSGDNFLKFYGDSKNEGLTLGSFTLTPNTNSLNTDSTVIYFDIALGKFEGGAKSKIDKSNSIWATKLGGKKNGALTVTVNIEIEGEYSLIITYYSSTVTTDKPLSLSLTINSKDTGCIYQLTRNKGQDKSIRKHEIIVNLKKGENTLKFAGDGKSETPDLGATFLTLKGKKN